EALVGARTDRGVVHEDVELGRNALDLSGDGRDAVEALKVAADRHPAELARELARGGLGARVAEDARPRRCERARNGSSDAAGGAGDEDVLPLQVHSYYVASRCASCAAGSAVTVTLSLNRRSREE